MISFENEKENALCEKKAKHIDDFPPEIFGKFIEKLTVGDRVLSERVSPRWKRLISGFGWDGQKKLDHEIVFEGTSPGAIIEFWGDIPAGRNFTRFPLFHRVPKTLFMCWGVKTNKSDCNLISLFHRFGQTVEELDLQSFGRHHQIQPFVPQIAQSLYLLTELKKLNIMGYQLSDFIDYLPKTLREIKSSHNSKISLKKLETLANRCPNLQEVPFLQVVGINLRIVDEFLPKFPRLKELQLVELSSDRGALISMPDEDEDGLLSKIGQLVELEELVLWNFEGLNDEGVFNQFIRGPSGRNLRRLELFLALSSVTKAQLLRLAELPNLEVLKVMDLFDHKFTDAVVEAIAKRGKLKRFEATFCILTDDSILHLIENCKSLVSLSVFDSPQITDRSVEAVVAEVKRRHGSPPRALPSGPLDPRIFYFWFNLTQIDKGRALALKADNPWLVYEFEGYQDVDDPRIIR